MNWYLTVLKNYVNFDGRARRQEYWMFVLFNIIFSAIAAGIDYSLGISVLGGLYSVVVFLPSIAVAVRRLHDINKSGWMLLVLLIPIIGLI